LLSKFRRIIKNEKINNATLHVAQIICQSLEKMNSENQTFL